ncbi:MAG: hypothetical protein ABSF26_12930 [Thermoguttaceae bacterium]
MQLNTFLESLGAGPWETHSTAPGWAKQFNIAALNANMDASPNWQGARQLIASYVDAVVAAGGGASVLR